VILKSFKLLELDRDSANFVPRFFGKPFEKRIWLRRGNGGSAFSVGSGSSEKVFPDGFVNLSTILQDSNGQDEGEDEHVFLKEGSADALVNDGSEVDVQVGDPFGNGFFLFAFTNRSGWKKKIFVLIACSLKECKY